MNQSILSDLVIGIDHVGICVKDLSKAEATWASLLGRPTVDHETITGQKVNVSFIGFPNQNTTIELICPIPDNRSLQAYVQNRGDAMHHIAFAVRDIREALTRLQEKGVPLIDTQPRQGARGHLVAFLHPKAMGGTLVELVEIVEHTSRST